MTVSVGKGEDKGQISKFTISAPLMAHPTNKPLQVLCCDMLWCTIVLHCTVAALLMCVHVLICTFNDVVVSAFDLSVTYIHLGLCDMYHHIMVCVLQVVDLIRGKVSKTLGFVLYSVRNSRDVEPPATTNATTDQCSKKLSRVNTSLVALMPITGR